MINIDFDNGIVEDFTIVLADRSLSHKGQILNTDDFVYKANMNSANEISFMVYQELDGNKERLWNDITDLKLVWVKEVDEYFEISVNIAESTNLVKNITGTSLCEAELSQTLLRSIEINTEADIERDDYVITKFYDGENHNGSLLHRVLEKVPHYSIKHVDSSLINLQRTFSIDNKSVYDFLIGECSEQFNCLFQFDSTDRSISVYDLYTVCSDCGHRGEFNDICPKCGSVNLSYYGQDTTIFVSAKNLTDEISYETDVNSIKNCFKLEAGDEDMTSAIMASNPNGSAYLYYFSEEQKKDMPAELVKKIASYDGLMDFYAEEYQGISEDLYDCIDKIIYYTSGMMPTIEMAEVTASTEAAKLTVENLSPIGLTAVTSSTSTATVNSALKNFAKVFVKTGYVKVEVDTGNFVYKGTDASGHSYGNWTGRFKVTNYSDEEDIAYSNTITVKVTDDYEYYLTQKIQKNISNNDSDDGSIYDVLSINNMNTFKEALTHYCYNRLESFADAIQGVINILIEEKQSNSNCDYYSSIYTPYYNKLTACQNEMNIRSATIKEYEDMEQGLIKHRNSIQSMLNFEDYLGEELYAIFCSYRREDTYKNDNFISDGLDNAEIFQKANEFMEIAKKEIIKSGEYQHSISASLYNLLVMDEFDPIKDKFDLGNWIRFEVDDSVYRLRLVSYQISGNNLSSIETEFANLTKTANGVNDIRSILQHAQSMATSYSYVSKQSEQGKKAQTTLKNFVKEGLNSSLINLKNNDMEEITFDNNGLLCKSYDDIANDYSPEQVRLTHNILCYTDDNWLTCKAALGKHDYYKYVGGVLSKHTGYGLTSDFMVGGVLNGSQIIGGEQYSQNYSSTTGSYINWNSGAFTLAGGRIKYDGNDSLVFRDVNLSWKDISDAPTNISAFNNDSNYTTMSAVENKGYQTESQVTQITKNTITTEYINAIDFNATGTFTTTTTRADGVIIKTSLRSGNIEFFSNNTKIGNLSSGRLTSTAGTYLNGINISVKGSFSIKGEDSSSVDYVYNPTNTAITNYAFTDRHTFYGTTRFRNAIYCHDIYIPPASTSNDSSQYVNLYNLAYDGSRAIGCGGGLYVYGSIGCSGTKHRVVDTEHYGKVGMNAFETPEPYFADIGSGIISEIGSTTIFIDPIFAETIDMDSEYQVFITSSSAQVCVTKEYDNFTVYGEAGTSFDWMICSKQKNYSAVRMTQINIDESRHMSDNEGEMEW